MMLLHAGAALAPHDTWGAWTFEPAVLILLGATLLLYARGTMRLSQRASRSQGRLRWQNVSFVAGFAVLGLALVSPLHRIGGVLFSAHMIQHELLMTVAAPLLVLGRPLVPMLWAIPQKPRRSIGLFTRRPSVNRLWTLITAPVVTWLLHASAIWIWHAPSLYDASVRSDAVHAAQHISFIVTALLFWWAMLQDSRAGLRGGPAIFYLFTTALHTSLLGALLSSADTPFYSAYSSAATAAWGLTPLEDQQLGGIIMWVPGGIAYVAAALLIFLGWMRSSTSRTLEREKAGRSLTVSAAKGVAAAMILLLGACSTNNDQAAAELTGGNPHRGRDAIRRYGCQSCHSIPGVRGAVAIVGPPLAGIADRSYIAGVLTNSPDHMIEWLRNPPGIDDKTAMPNLGMTEKDARDIAAYMYTLR